MRIRPLRCPFCNNLLARPVDISYGTIDIIGGICQCSAVYVLDRTGHNLGAAFMDALTFACKEDYDKALSLMPDEYETVDFDYDIHRNAIGKNPITGRAGKLLFLRLKHPE